MLLFNKEYHQEKRYWRGTHRTRDPQETMTEYGRHMPRLGITRLANVTHLDVIGLPVYLAMRPNSRALSVSQGKGLDDAAAKASALMESIESWHAERVEVPMRYESYWAMRDSVPVVDISQLLVSKAAVLRRDVPLLWVEGWDLLQQERVWVPYDTVSMNFVRSAHTTPTFLMGSNGLASGNHLLEAISHALCEVIERDAITSDFEKTRQIDLTTVDDPDCHRMLELLERAEVSAVVWDITTNIGIPAYTCIIYDGSDRPRWRVMGAYSGYGCHLSPAVALIRAIGEAVQSRVGMIAGSRDDMYPRYYTHNTNPDDLNSMKRSVEEPPPTTSFRTRASLATDTFEGDLAVLLEALARAQIERAVVVDLTKSELNIPVVKVVVPGLHWSGTAMPALGTSRRRTATLELVK